MLARDARDAGRKVAPLIKPPGAVEVDTTSLSEEEVIGRIVGIVRGGPGR